MLKLILLAVVGYIFYRALKSWLMTGDGRTLDKTPRGPNDVDDVLVQDPVCKTYIAQRKSLLLKEDGEILHFCSEQCRERYRSTHYRDSSD